MCNSGVKIYSTAERSDFMKEFISQNKLLVVAIVLDILTIAAIIVSFKYDIITWIAIVMGIIAVTLNVKAKRKQKEKFKTHNE